MAACARASIPPPPIPAASSHSSASRCAPPPSIACDMSTIPESASEAMRGMLLAWLMLLLGARDCWSIECWSRSDRPPESATSASSSEITST
ncbi:hypothetical protein K523DRAFT_337277 [Schizophyllum commune Tattone D]|nr:hypothetical protein K523DRAFT_337277 [Schizophyllum commune Tattone D]